MFYLLIFLVTLSSSSSVLDTSKFLPSFGVTGCNQKIAACARTIACVAAYHIHVAAPCGQFISGETDTLSFTSCATANIGNSENTELRALILCIQMEAITNSWPLPQNSECVVPTVDCLYDVSCSTTYDSVENQCVSHFTKTWIEIVLDPTVLWQCFIQYMDWDDFDVFSSGTDSTFLMWYNCIETHPSNFVPTSLCHEELGVCNNDGTCVQKLITIQNECTPSALTHALYDWWGCILTSTNTQPQFQQNKNLQNWMNCVDHNFFPNARDINLCLQSVEFCYPENAQISSSNTSDEDENQAGDWWWAIIIFAIIVLFFFLCYFAYNKFVESVSKSEIIQQGESMEDMDFVMRYSIAPSVKQDEDINNDNIDWEDEGKITIADDFKVEVFE